MLTPYLGAIYGGTSKVVRELASSLGRLNLSVDIVTTTANDAGSLDVVTNDWLIQNNHRVHYFPTWHRSDLIFSPTLIRWLNQHLKDYDLVHTHTLFSPLVTLAHGLCRFHKVPYIMTPHGMLEPWALSYKAWKKKLYHRAFERFALKGASAIHVLARSEAEHVQALGNYPTVTVPNGIHPEGFLGDRSPDIFYQQFPETRDKTLILFLGRIDPKKGLDLLAPAFAQAHAKFPNTHLIVAGPDSINFMPTAKSYFSATGCLDAVTFTGMLTGDLKQAALTAADIYAAPSYSEGFSMSILEGMASGLPAVITTGCNFPEAATAEAAYVVDISAQAIGDALIQCLKNEFLAKALGSRAKKFILQGYTWEQSAKQLNDLYSTVIQKERPPTLNATVSIT